MSFGSGSSLFANSCATWANLAGASVQNKEHSLPWNSSELAWLPRNVSTEASTDDELSRRTIGESELEDEVNNVISPSAERSTTERFFNIPSVFAIAQANLGKWVHASITT